MNPHELDVLRDELRRELMAEVFAAMARRRARSRRILRVALPIGLLVIPLAAWAVTIPNTFVNGTVADANQVNANFQALADALNLHEPDPSAHHTKTTNASELTSGVLADARLSANVSLLGALIEPGELGFDPATQAELDLHAALPAAHHARYTDGEAIAAVGPHVTSIGGLAGGTVLGSVASLGEVESQSGGFRFPDASLQTSAADVFPNRLLVAPSGGDFTSIQAAIDSVTPTAASPWLIEIAAGTYLEELTLKSYVRLQGAGAEATIIRPSTLVVSHVTATKVSGVRLASLTLEGPQPSSPAERALALVSSSVELEDVRITGYSDELIDASSSTLTIRQSRLLDPLFDLNRGVDLHQSTATISGSTLDTRDCAISADASDLILTRSVVSFEVCATGAVTPRPSVLLSHNRLSSVDVSLVRAEIVGNRIRSDNGGKVAIRGSEPCQLVGNEIDVSSSSTAVIVSGVASIVGNSIRNTSPAGDGIFNSGTAQILGNRIEVAGKAINDVQAALIVGNEIAGAPMTAISASTSSILMGNRVPAGYSTNTEERWLSPRAIRVQSTGQGVELAAGGSVVTLDASGNISIQAAGDLDLSATNVSITATNGIGITAANGVDVTAAGTVDVNGSLINLN